MSLTFLVLGLIALIVGVVMYFSPQSRRAGGIAAGAGAAVVGFR
jgi:hypothetical protein